jgi:hypothetical protein
MERGKSLKKLVMAGMGIFLLMLTLEINPASAQPAATAPVGGPITLDFNSLPSAQGWTYQTEDSSVAEADVFSVSNGILHQNTLGKGGLTARYTLPNVVDAYRPFTLSVRARVLEHEGDDLNPWSFDLIVMTGAESFEVGISPTVIRSTTGTFFSTTIDNTQFHDYRMEGIPGVSLRFFVDNVLVGSDVPYPFVYPNQLWLSDSTQGSNARAEIASYSFVQPPLNSPPDCSMADPSVTTIWPPNHQFVPVNVLGVTDTDEDSVSISINSIWQDEPVNTVGDGNSTPDGQGVGTATAEVRAERIGSKKVTGNGRVYHISFTADDGNGGSCVGEVHVAVPQNQGQGSVPIDDGALYNSTIP